jgi:hypothetical protein
MSNLTSTTPCGEHKQSESDNCVWSDLLSYPWKKLVSLAASPWPAERPFSLWDQPVFISEKEFASDESSGDEDDGRSSPLGSYCSDPSEADGKDDWSSLSGNSSDLSDADEKCGWSPLGSFHVAYHYVAHHAAVVHRAAAAAENAFAISEDAFWSSTSSDYSDQSSEVPAVKRPRGRRGGRQRSARRRRQQESKIFVAMQEDDQRRLSFNPCPHGV